MHAFIVAGNRAISLGHIVRARFVAAVPASDEVDEETGRKFAGYQAGLTLVLTSLETVTEGYDTVNAMASKSEYERLEGAEAERAWAIICGRAVVDEVLTMRGAVEEVAA